MIEKQSFGRKPSLWSAYNCKPRPSDFRLLAQEILMAECRAEFSAGSSIDAKMAIMAMTTRSSIKVKPRSIDVFLVRMSVSFILPFQSFQQTTCVRHLPFFLNPFSPPFSKNKKYCVLPNASRLTQIHSEFQSYFFYLLL